MDGNRIVFGSPPVLTLEVKRHLFPESDSYVDRNMLAVNATVVAGRFRGFLETQLRTDELARFRDIIREMYKRLRGEWHQEFLGSGLDFKIKGDGLGHFTMTCVADDSPGMGNELTFEIGFEQTAIPEMLKALDRVISNFPVRPD
jgi:hypothetical protein